MASILAIGIFVSSAFSQSPVPPIPPQAQEKPIASAGSSVPGLELPSDQTVNYDEGFVTLQAKTKGEVKWLVVSGVKVKYVTVTQTNSIIVSIPPTGGVIGVFAVAVVDGKITEFARTNITVVGNTPPGPGPGPIPPNPPGPNPPTPNPVDPLQKLHITFLVDMNNVQPEMAKLLNSETLIKGINQRGHWFRRYDIKAPVVAQKKLDQVVQRIGGNAILIIQSDDGRVLNALAIPKTEQEIFSLIQQITGR
jgi:hypothetical protein